MNFKKYYTVQEASNTLPYVKTIVYDILATAKEIKEFQKKENTSAGDMDNTQKLSDKIIDCIAELEELGCFYKDWNFEIGLVDFPALIDDREVYLCWRSDEEELKYYHEIDAGYPGRKLITK